jgi:hypothetical protein
LGSYQKRARGFRFWPFQQPGPHRRCITARAKRFHTVHPLASFRKKPAFVHAGKLLRYRGMDATKAEEAPAMMRIYDNGYNCIPRRTDFIYNPTLCPYFFKQFQ